MLSTKPIRKLSYELLFSIVMIAVIALNILYSDSINSLMIYNETLDLSILNITRMNSTYDFNKYCPKVPDKYNSYQPSNVIIKYRKYIYLLLIITKEFCDKHNIQYVLSDGTVLGAVRHNALIPWDDDIG